LISGASAGWIPWADGRVCVQRSRRRGPRSWDTKENVEGTGVQIDAVASSGTGSTEEGLQILRRVENRTEAKTSDGITMIQAISKPMIIMRPVHRSE
jgi:hypothetical protein